MNDQELRNAISQLEVTGDAVRHCFHPDGVIEIELNEDYYSYDISSPFGDPSFDTGRYHIGEKEQMIEYIISSL